ncbi:MAG: methyltransferase domain-containing protein [Myxococcales bacterium]|nr:methyltransferase domain-containing protein [Myxococcales bacterium]
MAERDLDPDRMKEAVRLVYGTMQGALTAAMLHLGDRLGLFRELDSGGSATSAELAERTGLDERWLREWLRQQGAAGILEFDADERFTLGAEGAAILADEDHPAFAGGVFSQLPSTMAVLDRLPEAFRSGLGLPYDAFGAEGARGVERGFAPWYRNFLVPVAIPRLEGVRERLEAGASVADVGCGGGVALLVLAEAFPASRFRGYDVSGHALERAEQNRREAGLDNVTFHDPRAEPLPTDGSVDLVLTFDCLHDMTHPAEVTGAIHAALAEDGVWLIADIKAHDTFHANAEENPMAAMMYGFSVMSCMSSALSEPGGAGLGTLGFPEAVARKMTESAGFTRFRSLDLGHPINAFYEVRR